MGAFLLFPFKWACRGVGINVINSLDVFVRFASQITCHSKLLVCYSAMHMALYSSGMPLCLLWCRRMSPTTHLFRFGFWCPSIVPLSIPSAPAYHVCACAVRDYDQARCECGGSMPKAVAPAQCDDNRGQGVCGAQAP